MGIIAETWTTEEGVQLDVQRATGLRRATGLIGRRPPLARAGLLIGGCRSVHGVGILAPLDVVFLDGDGRVVAVRRLRRFAVVSERSACAVLELAGGEAERLGIARGTRLKKISREKG